MVNTGTVTLLMMTLAFIPRDAKYLCKQLAQQAKDTMWQLSPSFNKILLIEDMDIDPRAVSDQLYHVLLSYLNFMGLSFFIRKLGYIINFLL